MKILITNDIHFAGLEMLKDHNITYDILNENENITKCDSSYSAIISMLGDKIDTNFINSNTHLKVISNYAVGYNNINILEATKHNIYVGNTPDVLTDATADLTFALILATTRNLKAGLKNIEQGLWKKWEPLGFLGMGLKSKTLGIIGMGRIGQAVAKRAFHGFEMNVCFHHTSLPDKQDDNYIYNDNHNHKIQQFCSNPETKNYHYLSFDQLLKKSDIISLHCPLNKSTEQLFNRNIISKMKPGSYFINTARGTMHDEQALFEALQAQHLRGVGLDVTNPEPMLTSSKLLNHENAFIVPHIGSATDHARKQMSLICAENIILGLQGKKTKYILN